jgi:hypothetical protein
MQFSSCLKLLSDVIGSLAVVKQGLHSVTTIQTPHCLIHSSVYLVESVSAQSYLRAIFLDLNYYIG